MKALFFILLLVTVQSLTAQEKRAYFLTKNTYITNYQNYYLITTSDKDVYQKVINKFKPNIKSILTSDSTNKYYTITFNNKKSNSVEVFIKSL